MIKVYGSSSRIQAAMVIGGLFLFSLLCFLMLLRVPRIDGQLIGSDGSYYYVYVRSLVVDHDIDFRNEYLYYDLSASTASATATGLAPNKYAIGPAILWLPFFLVAHLIAHIGQWLGMGIIPDGYGYLYQGAISIGSIVYGALGFLLAYRTSQRWFSVSASLSAIVLLWLASNAFYYMVFEPSMAHMVSLFSVAFLLTIWAEHIRQADPPKRIWAIVLGVASGLVALVRLQDSVMLALPYGTILLHVLLAWRNGQVSRAWHWLGFGCVAGAVAMVVFTPQLLAWQILYGSWVVSPYLQDHNPAFYWLTPQITGVLFSTFHGLFSWHPIYLFALLGLPILLDRDRGLAIGMAAALSLNIYLVAAWWAWWQGDSFGGRMFLSVTWIWVIGLAALLDWLRQRRRLRAALLLGICLIGWNSLALAQYRLGYVPMSQPLSWQQMTIERLRLPWTILARRP